MLPIPYIHNVCLMCKSEREKARYQALTPTQKRERGRRANEAAMKRRHKLEQRLQRYRQRVGAPKRHINDDILIDLLPLRMFLLRQARIRKRGISGIAETVGIDEALVRMHVNGFYWESDCRPRPVRSVTLGTVDRYLSMLDVIERLEDLYPEIDDLLEGYFSE